MGTPSQASKHTCDDKDVYESQPNTKTPLIPDGRMTVGREMPRATSQ